MPDKSCGLLEEETDLNRNKLNYKPVPKLLIRLKQGRAVDVQGRQHVPVQSGHRDFH